MPGGKGAVRTDVKAPPVGASAEFVAVGGRANVSRLAPTVDGPRLLVGSVHGRVARKAPQPPPRPGPPLPVRRRHVAVPVSPPLGRPKGRVGPRRLAPPGEAPLLLWRGPGDEEDRRVSRSPPVQESRVPGGPWETERVVAGVGEVGPPRRPAVRGTCDPPTVDPRHEALDAVTGRLRPPPDGPEAARRVPGTDTTSGSRAPLCSDAPRDGVDPRVADQWDEVLDAGP